MGGCITKTPCGGEVKIAGPSPVDRRKQAWNG
jgi:hypothetical protein